MTSHLTDILSKHSLISYSKLREEFKDGEKELSKQLHKLLDEKVISKRVVLICPNCFVTVSQIEDVKDAQEIKCDNCDHLIEITDDYFEPFFFSNCIINI